MRFPVNVGPLLATIFLALSFGVNANAESRQKNGVPISELQEIKVRLTDRENLSGRFIQKKILHNFKFPIESSGNFAISTDGKLTWNVERPITNSVTISQTGIFVDQKNVTSNSASDTKSAANPRPEIAIISQIVHAVLSMDWPVLEEHFIMTVEEPAPHWKVSLAPRSTQVESNIERIDLSGEIDLEKVIIHDAQKNKTVIAFEVASNQP